MRNLLEVVLEDIPKPRVYQALCEILDKATSLETILSHDGLEVIDSEIFAHDQFERFLSRTGSDIIEIKVGKLILGSAELKDVHLRIVKYDDKFDIDFNFYAACATPSTAGEVMRGINKAITDICCSNTVHLCFGGIDPAADTATRYFTNGNFGPLS